MHAMRPSEMLMWHEEDALMFGSFELFCKVSDRTGITAFVANTTVTVFTG